MVYTLRAGDMGINPHVLWSSHTSHLIMGILGAKLPGAWLVGSVLGLFRPMSVFCDWVR